MAAKTISDVTGIEIRDAKDNVAGRLLSFAARGVVVYVRVPEDVDLTEADVRKVVAEGTATRIEPARDGLAVVRGGVG